MDLLLELAKSRVTNRYLAEHLGLSDAESLLRGLRETVAFLERRIAREKINTHKPQPVVDSQVSLTT